MKRPVILSAEEISERMKNSIGWSLVDNALQKEFYFATYMDGVKVLNQIAEIAEALDHHPELKLSYRKLKVKTCTHEPSGITELDFNLLAKIENLFGKAV